jgi:hypothetical protein
MKEKLHTNYNLLYQVESWDVAMVKEELLDEVTVEEHEVCLGR